VSKKWNFCPICGRKVERQTMAFKIINKQFEQIGKFMGLGEFQSRIQELPSGGVSITIRSGGPKTVQKSSHTYSPETRQIKQRKLPKVTIEPKSNVKRLSKEIVINVKLPGIDSEQDIELHRFENSVEVRAYTGDKGYFKIFKIPQNSRIIERKLENNNLIMRFSA